MHRYGHGEGNPGRRGGSNRTPGQPQGSPLRITTSPAPTMTSTNPLRFVVVLCCLLVVLSGCASLFSGVSGSGSQEKPTVVILPATPTPTAEASPTPLTDSALAQKIVQGMSLDDKLGQMVIVEFYGSTLTGDDIQMIHADHVSGVLIENKNGNAQTRSQLIALNTALQGQAQIPLFITTDFEGGIVNELRQITGERPSEQAIGATGNTQNAYNAGLSAAKDLTAIGLNVNFMPIVDVLTNPNNPGLPMRTFGSNPTLVTNMGRAYLEGLTKGGVVGCLKHFPGLGSANLDPHFSLPYMNRSLATLNAVDLVPYRTMINEGIVPMVMVTHILNPQLDPKLPTSLSPNVVTGLLRDQLNFKGVIISDTLWMGGISNTYSLAQAAVLAVKAGTDLLLGPRGLSDTQSMITGLKQAVQSGQISMDKINASVQRILELKLKYKILSHDKALQLIDNQGTFTTDPTGLVRSTSRGRAAFPVGIRAFTTDPTGLVRSTSRGRAAFPVGIRAFTGGVWESVAAANGAKDGDVRRLAA